MHKIKDVNTIYIPDKIKGSIFFEIVQYIYTIKREFYYHSSSSVFTKVKNCRNLNVKHYICV